MEAADCRMGYSSWEEVGARRRRGEEQGQKEELCRAGEAEAQGQDEPCEGESSPHSSAWENRGNCYHCCLPGCSSAPSGGDSSDQEHSQDWLHCSSDLVDESNSDHYQGWLRCSSDFVDESNSGHSQDWLHCFSDLVDESNSGHFQGWLRCSSDLVDESNSGH